MEPHLSQDAARAMLEWMVELGADEAIGDAPLDRFDLGARRAPTDAVAVSAAPDRPAVPRAAQPEPKAAADPEADAVQSARAAAAAAEDLQQLAGAMAAFDGCELRLGARNLVFADGNPAADVMIIGEAPGREEDQKGLPFVGQAGQLLDRMFAAIGLSRRGDTAQNALYITNVLPWRPPGNRDPAPAEIAMMLPFLARHVELAAPRLLVLMGNTPCAAALGRRGILRLRGHWQEAFGIRAMPMTHPAYLLRSPAAKREAWSDLLALQAELERTHG